MNVAWEVTEAGSRYVFSLIFTCPGKTSHILMVFSLMEAVLG